MILNLLPSDSDPIKRVSVYVPPVVATNKIYNATAMVETISHLRGDDKLVGSVEYQWKTSTSAIEVLTNFLKHLNKN